MKKAVFLQVLVAAILGFAPGFARADLYAAGKAYDEKDFAVAFQLYRELAELGQVYAQQSLAVMYVNAEGVPRDNIAGYAWATIAKENGASGEAVQAIIDQLEPHMNEKARQKVAEIKAQFGGAALDNKLLPRIFEGANYTDRTPCRLSKQASTLYPRDALDRGIQGNVYMEFTVMPDGHARNPRVVYSVPTGMFEEAARRTIMHSEFSPSTQKGVPVPCTTGTMVMFVIDGVEKSDYTNLNAFVKKSQKQAEAGDPRAQMLYGLLISGLPQIKKPRSDAMPYFVKAAQSGVPTAQFLVGYSSMLGWGCECDEPKAMFWLHRAAAADQSDAQVMIANYILRGEPGPEEIGKALTWLERAASHGSRDGKFYLAALLAAGVDAGRRDPERALKVLKDVMRDMDDDPTAFEIRAAAYAMLGNFTEAQKDERKALRMAQGLGWETASQQTRLANYVASKPWTGDLFAF
ncbi:MAG TPA: TonB family protein [Steroidobacteraceae bacterium]|jgi:TonB family protein|nr:TonB family protein [Steroidobacteraceae bacterium]